MAALVTSSLTVNGLTSSLTVTAFSGTEAMSTLYAIELSVSSADTSLDLDALAGETAVLSMVHGSNVRYVHGVLSLLEQTTTTDLEATYRAVLVPTVWLLSQRSDCRIFQGITAPDLIAQILTERGVTAYQMSLLRTYATRDVVIQYRESDWAFLSRLMEDEGIFYYFEHTSSAVTLVIADSATVHEDIEPKEIGYLSSSGALDSDEGISTFSFARRVRPGMVTTREVTFDDPASYVEETASATTNTDLLVFDYPMTQAASDKLDALQATSASGTATAGSVRLVPGFLFSLADHPRSSFNAGYLVTTVTHTFETTSGYTAALSCVPAGTTVRPEQTTAKPTISGPQAATVVGTEGAEIETDAKGRVKVKLHWDRLGSSADNSCWVHVAQMASGVSYGGMVIPRIGSAVLVDFLDGDIDQPIVTGRVYNTVSPYPYTLPDDVTQWAVKTQSTPYTGGYNELRFQDAAGSEEVTLRAERDLTVSAQNDATRTIGNDETIAVTGNRVRSIGGTETISVTGARTITVVGSEARTIGVDETVTVLGAETWSVAGDQAVTVGGDQTVSVVGNRTVSTALNVIETIAGTESVTVTGDRTLSALASDTQSVASNHSLSVGGTMQRIVDGHCSLTFGSFECNVIDGTTDFTASGVVHLESETEVQIGGPNIYLFADSTIRIRAQDKIVLEIGNAEDEDGNNAKIEITSGGITVTNGEATEKMSGGTIKLNC